MYGVIVMEYGYPHYKEVPGTIFSDLYDYVKTNKDVARVVIPHTYYGYGSSLIDNANSEWLELHYPRAVKNVEFNVTISRWKFLHSSGEELREIIEKLAEDYPLISDDIHARLETEAKQEAFTAWIASDIDPDMTPEQIEDVMSYLGLSVWEIAFMDNDGATVYTEKADIESLQTAIAELLANL